MNEKWVKSSAAVYAFIFVLILSSVVQAQSMFVAGQQVSQLTEAQKQQLLNRHAFSAQTNQRLLDVLPGDLATRQSIINELIITLKIRNTPYIGSWAKNYVRILKRINTEPGSQDKTKVIALLIQFNTLEVEAIREAAFIKTAADAQIAPEKQAFDAYLVGVLKDLNGKENEALRYYQQAVELMPNIPRFLNSAAHSASNNKNYHLSAAYLQRALIIASKPGGIKGVQCSIVITSAPCGLTWENTKRQLNLLSRH